MTWLYPKKPIEFEPSQKRFFFQGFHTQNEGRDHFRSGQFVRPKGQHMVKPREEPGRGRLMPGGINGPHTIHQMSLVRVYLPTHEWLIWCIYIYMPYIDPMGRGETSVPNKKSRVKKFTT